MKLLMGILNNRYVAIAISITVVTPIYFLIIQPFLASLHPVFEITASTSYRRYPNDLAHLIYMVSVMVFYMKFGSVFVDYE